MQFLRSTIWHSRRKSTSSQMLAYFPRKVTKHYNLLFNVFFNRCLSKFLSTIENQNCPKCQCRAVLMDNIDSIRTSSASSVIEVEHNLATLTSQAIQSRPNPVDQIITVSRTSPTLTPRDVSTTMLDAIKPNGPALNVVSTFVSSPIPSTSTAGLPTKPKILVQRPSDEMAFASNCTPPPTRPANRECVDQKRRSDPVILSSNARQYPPLANHKPNCNRDTFPMLSEELFNEPSSSPRNFEIHFETLEELVAYQGPSVTDV